MSEPLSCPVCGNAHVPQATNLDSFAILFKADGRWFYYSWGHNRKAALKAAAECWDGHEPESIRIEPTPSNLLMS